MSKAGKVVPLIGKNNTSKKKNAREHSWNGTAKQKANVKRR